MKRILLNTSLLAIIACLLWSSASTFIKIGLQYSTPIEFAGWRFFLAGLLVVPFLGNLKSHFQNIVRLPGVILITAFIQTFLLYTLFYLGVSLIPASIASIMLGAQPLVTAVVVHFVLKDDKITLRKLIVISIGLIGVVLIAVNQGFTHPGDYKLLLGMSFLLTGNIASAVGNIIVMKMRKDIPALSFNSWQMTLGGLGLLTMSLFIEPVTFEVQPLPYYLSLAWLIFVSATAYSLWFILLQREGVKISEINIWKFILPLMGAILSWSVFQNEKPTWATVTGMLLIVASLIIYYLPTRQK